MADEENPLVTVSAQLWYNFASYRNKESLVSNFFEAFLCELAPKLLPAVNIPPSRCVSVAEIISCCCLSCIFANGRFSWTFLSSSSVASFYIVPGSLLENTPSSKAVATALLAAVRATTYECRPICVSVITFEGVRRWAPPNLFLARCG